jgi:hypothetical protein
MSNFHSGPPIDASNQVSVHLAKQFQKAFIDPAIVPPQPNQLKLGRKHLSKVLCKDCSFRPDDGDPLTNMAATGDSCL